jgi:hypothetical protein
MSDRMRERRRRRAFAAHTDKLDDFAKQSHDLDAVRKSIEDAASVSGTLWFSYLFSLFYFGIAAGAVTHKDLLLENAVKLPFLNVDLPLVAFFALAPILFVISHAYTLMHFVLLSAKVGKLKQKLNDQLAGPEAHETREDLRWQLPSNIFVQFLAGPHNVRDGVLGWLLKGVAWISLVVGPVSPSHRSKSGEDRGSHAGGASNGAARGSPADGSDRLSCDGS